MSSTSPLYAFLMRNLRAKRIDQRTVAAASGVPFSTVTKIAQGAVTNPTLRTAQRLADFFASQDPAGQPCPCCGQMPANASQSASPADSQQQRAA